MFLITNGENEGVLFANEDDALRHCTPEDLAVGGYLWISRRPIPYIGGFQDISVLPEKWRIFAEGFRAAELCIGDING